MRRLAVLLSLVLISSQLYAARLYRFNVDGQLILKDHVPPELAQNGYDILNERGFVIETVAPAPTAEELAQIQAEEARKQARRDRIRERRDADMALLRLYSKPADVDRARKRKIENIDGYISLQQRRILDLTETLEKAQGSAANLERGGDEIPVELRLEIAQLQNQIRESHETIRQRKEEKKADTEMYADQLLRMHILMKYPPGTLESDLPEDVVKEIREAAFPAPASPSAEPQSAADGSE